MCLPLVLACVAAAAAAEAGLQDWPASTRDTRPWSYWWWLGSAVDTNNLAQELRRYAAAGWGGVHIIPIYGAKGWEDRYIDYLSPRWMDMLQFTVREARRLDLGVDMTLGSGWCFGGPTVTDLEANARLAVQTIDVPAGSRLTRTFDPASTHGLVAVPPDGPPVELTSGLRPDGTVDWQPKAAAWRVYALSQKPSGRTVKRAAPGGQGHMLNLIYPDAVRHYVERFTRAFAGFEGPRPRALYHDSYEYVSDWAPDFLARFAQRRGYPLTAELPALLGAADDDRSARVKSDYRETVADIMAEDSLPIWAGWARDHGFLTRNQAHGSPGNLLDLYAVADIPETEMFHRDRSLLVSKFASSSAHVLGKPRVAAETGTWLKEHWTETLADLKALLDDLFLAGVNHVFFHGTCYSPDEAPWPGWLFYASTQMNPRNPIWRDVPALAAYIARCQSLLQAGHPDPDLLVYWPIHDLWHDPKGLVQPLTVHRRAWLERQPLGRTASWLWEHGFGFDYISDRQLARLTVRDRRLVAPGGAYRALVVPECHLMPLPTLQRLRQAAQAGATVLFENQLPSDVPGWNRLDSRRQQFRSVLASLQFATVSNSPLRLARVGAGRVVVGDLAAALSLAAVPRETLNAHPGVHGLRRRVDKTFHYFIAHRGDQPLDGWVPLAVHAAAVVIMDPLTGQTGLGAVRAAADGRSEVYLQLTPGASLILRVLDHAEPRVKPWAYWTPDGAPVELRGDWRIEFLGGGPSLPPAVTTADLGSWTDLGGDAFQAFAGTARYTTTFEAPPPGAGAWALDLGRVAQSARVRLNGRELGSLILAPYRLLLPGLEPGANLLEVEVTSVAANRIRDLDRRRVVWRSFHDINFVNLDYKPFDASAWPLTPAGLLGPVHLVPMRAKTPP